MNEDRPPAVVNRFPLYLQFELEREGYPTLTLKASFRGWEHWLAYVAQCYERNGARARRPIELADDGTKKIIH